MSPFPLRFDWGNTLFLIAVHVFAVLGVLWAVFFSFSWWTVGLAIVWFALCGVAITGGYHRLFSHPTYKAGGFVRALYLFFGAGAVQNSALKWSSDHRRHHAKVDEEEDPYNIRRGFLWAHLGWVLFRDPPLDFANVRDLEADPLVRFQHRYYVWLALLAAAAVPVAVGTAWGDPIGALLLVGFLRLALQYHATFAVNSLAHSLGSQPYSRDNSARDSFVTAIVTLGEGYHNFHHRFQSDYRNGVRFYHFDPTKWWVWSLSKVGLAWDLRRVSAERIQAARQRV